MSCSGLKWRIWLGQGGSLRESMRAPPLILVSNKLSDSGTESLGTYGNMVWGRRRGFRGRAFRARVSGIDARAIALLS